MAAIARFQLLQPSSVVKPSVILSKLSHSTPIKALSLYGTRIRKLSVRRFCCASDQTPEISSNSGSCSSIVADLLDYLNESWTQFHATDRTEKGIQVYLKSKSHVGDGKDIVRCLNLKLHLIERDDAPWHHSEIDAVGAMSA
ncbi:unnamed protein product [Ilex paraguariensis]|uniref:Uncharacterized protein n=1 Tax=Ilex paraguariensis TaxID=185542 RepID=A0ABC8U8E3_9AQUA